MRHRRNRYSESGRIFERIRIAIVLTHMTPPASEPPRAPTRAHLLIVHRELLRAQFAGIACATLQNFAKSTIGTCANHCTCGDRQSSTCQMRASSPATAHIPPNELIVLTPSLTRVLAYAYQLSHHPSTGTKHYAHMTRMRAPRMSPPTTLVIIACHHHHRRRVVVVVIIATY